MSRMFNIASGVSLSVAIFLTASAVQAAICFLPDCGNKTTNANTNKDAQKCKDEGYESFQNRVCSQYSLIDFCPYNSDYIKCNNKQWCIINEYTYTECEPPTELFNKCPNGEEMYKECKLNMEDACLEEDNTYVSTCPAGWVIDPNDHCSLSDEFGHCCNTCPGFTTKEEIEAAGKTPVASCDSCDGKKYIAGSEGYNSCEGYWDCQDGCAPDAKTCVSFGVTKCDKCKRCEARCDLEECPEGALCEYENCTQRYCAIACGADMTYYCTTPITDCDILGFTNTIESCEGSSFITCPSDPEKVVCLPDDGTCCNKCVGYDYESAPEGYVISETCSCCGKRKHKVVANPCLGFSKCKYGENSGASSCLHGTERWYDSCKECQNACDGNTQCPAGSICEKDTCSNTFCPIGCEINYDNFCDTPNTNCRNLGYEQYSSECSSGAILYCPYDKNWVLCLDEGSRDNCNNYTHLSIPTGYVEESRCTYQGVTKYKIKAAPCEGYEYCISGPDTGAQSCLSGDVTKYDKCKFCPNATEYTSCPTGYVCEKDTCSNTYNPTGCATDYTQFCNQVTTNCSDLGYQPYDSSCAGKDMLYCPYNSSYVLCYDKNTCEGYNYTSIPDGYVSDGTCVYAGTTKYKIKPQDCGSFVELSSCKFGAAADATTCKSGTTTLYSSCKECANATEYTSCPTGYVCEKDECSSTYNPTGCATNYVTYCTTPTTSCRELGYEQYSSECSSGAILYCPYDKNWVLCLDEGSRDNCNNYTHLSIPTGYVEESRCTYQGVTKYKIKAAPCEGYQTCQYGATGDTTDTCLSGNVTKYKQCKECPEAFSYTSCPTGYVCEKDTCSNTYNPTGCAADYTQFCNQVITNCVSLGYSRYTNRCEGQDILYCPYDSNYVICTAKYNCDGYDYLASEIPTGYISAGTCPYNGQEYHKIEPNPCTGFYRPEECDSQIVDTSSPSCLSGIITKYKKCCNNSSCS